MAAFQQRKNGDGSFSTTASVRIKGFRPTSKTFKAATQKEADAIAEAWARDQERTLRAARSSGSGAPDMTSIVIRDLCNRYLEDPDTQLLKDYKGRLEQMGWWSDHYGDAKCMSFGTTRLFEARALLMSTGKRGTRAPATVNRHLAGLRSAFSWGKRTGLIAPSFAWPTRLSLKEPKPRALILDTTQYQTLLSEAMKQPPEFLVPFVLCLATGARRGEAERAKWGDIDLDRATWSIPDSKADLPRGNFLPHFAVAILRPLAEGRRPGDRVMPYSRTYIEKRWQKVRARAGLPAMKWHGTRHAFASALVMNGATLYEAQHALGHKSSASTQRYAHLATARPTVGHAGFESMFRERKA